ncbi:hypothetical protein HT031_003063 [Scenedesmus sp. PABB004]|nr:hypothetical protein HT031_003063 [Scenedesmus sp. PABB004]
MEHLASASRNVAAFVRSSDQFQAACSAAFDQVDVRGTGRVPISHVALATCYFFRDVSAAVDDYGIRIAQPTAAEVQKILVDSGYDSAEDVSREEFEALYVAILKFAAVKFAHGFCAKYGVGMAVGFAATVIVKRALRAIPIVGPVARPLLGLLPAPLLGPLLGILGVYIADRGDLADVKAKLFPKRGGQFKAG